MAYKQPAIIRARRLPIVLITSHYDSNTIKRATKSGVMGYLIKPLRDDELDRSEDIDRASAMRRRFSKTGDESRKFFIRNQTTKLLPSPVVNGAI